MKHYTHFILTGLLLLSSYIKVQAQSNIRFEHLSLEDGLSQSWAKCILQDKRGFLWIGTQDGLNRYDGYGFKIYRNAPNGLSGSDINCLGEAPEGILWAGTSNGLNRINTYTGKVERFMHDENNANSINHNEIRTLIVDKAGLVWIGTDKGLDIFDYKRNRYRHVLHDPDDSSIKVNYINCLYEDSKGKIWMGTEQGLNSLDLAANKFQRYTHLPSNPQSISSNFINCITEDRDGKLWIGTSAGLNCFDPVRKSFTRYLHDNTNKNSIGSNTISGIIEDERGVLWIVTENGLNLFDRDKQNFTLYRHIPDDPQSLYNNELNIIYKDREEIIWIGGVVLHKYNPRTRFFKHYIHNPADNNSLSDNHVFPMLEDRKGILWIGTLNKGLNRFDRVKNKWTHYRHHPKNPSSISHDRIWHLHEDRSGKLWMTTNRGLDRLDPQTGKFTRYLPDHTDPQSLSSNPIVGSVLEDRFGHIWVTADDLNRLDVTTGKFTRFRHDPKDTTTIGNGNLSYLFEDNDGMLWIGSFGFGLNRYNPATNTFKRYVHRPGDAGSLNNMQVNCIYQTRNGKLWIGGQSGIDCLDPQTQTFTHYREKDGLPNEVVYRIEEDAHGALWISTNRGIARLDPKTGKFSYYDTSDGLQSMEFAAHSSGQIRQTGELFFGGINGFNIFHPDSIRDNQLKPSVYISKLRRYPSGNKSGKSLEEDIVNRHELTFSYKDNLLAFEFLALSFSKPSKNQYAYQLQGFSNQWYQLGTKREVTFAGLPPGNYTLLVKASNGDGVWNDSPARLVITILPPWWRTGWAYAFYALCVLAGVFALHRFQRQRLIRKERERAREKELEQAKETEKAYDELKKTQAQLIQSEKMASLGELTAGIAHEIQNPLNFVNNFSEVNKELIEELRQEKNKANNDKIEDEILNNIEENLEKVIHHGKRADAIVKGMLQHSRINTGQKEPTDINALADEYLRLSYHGLRAKDKTFNATIKTDIDNTIGKVNIVPQDIGRVLLNLFNNAFYAVTEKKKQASEGYEPTISVSIKKLKDKIEIKIKDNGVGIPQKVLDKIFQPFFTTKPTGQGTGLGLYLAYDIITKGHGGQLKVGTKEGEWTEFIIQLPAI